MDKQIDNTELSFVTDENVIGKWLYVDFVQRVENFVAGETSWIGSEYINKIEFKPDGSVWIKVETEYFTPSNFTWTKGFVLNKYEGVCSVCEIKEINGSNYLFFEWKSGDYIYRSKEPWFYVFKREEEL